MVVILSLIDTSYFFSFCHRCKLPIGENRVFVLVMKEEKQNFPQRIMYISEETQTVFIVNRWVKLSGIAFYCVFSIEPWKVALYSKLHSIQERCSILGESFISQSNQIRTDAVNKLIWLLVDIKKTWDFTFVFHTLHEGIQQFDLREIKWDICFIDNVDTTHQRWNR